jgi:hypothetical protein
MSWALVAVHRRCSTRLTVEPTTPDEEERDGAMRLVGYCPRCDVDVPEGLWGWADLVS